MLLHRRRRIVTSPVARHLHPTSRLAARPTDVQTPAAACLSYLGQSLTPLALHAGPQSSPTALDKLGPPPPSNRSRAAQVVFPFLSTPLSFLSSAPHSYSHSHSHSDQEQRTASVSPKRASIGIPYTYCPRVPVCPRRHKVASATCCSISNTHNNQPPLPPPLFPQPRKEYRLLHSPSRLPCLLTPSAQRGLLQPRLPTGPLSLSQATHAQVPVYWSKTSLFPLPAPARWGPLLLLSSGKPSLASTPAPDIGHF